MILKPFQYNPNIAHITSLLSQNITPEERSTLEHELWLYKQGNSGEKQVAYYIDFELGSSKNYIVIHDLYLVHNGLTAQIDTLIINRFQDFYVIETKNYSSLFLDENGDCTVKFGKYAKSVASPVFQNVRHITLLRQILKDRLGLSINANKFHNIIAVLPTTYTKCTYPQSKAKVIKADRLVSEVLGENQPSSVLADLFSLAHVSRHTSFLEQAKAILSLHQIPPIKYQPAPVPPNTISQQVIPADSSPNPLDEILVFDLAPTAEVLPTPPPLQIPAVTPSSIETERPCPKCSVGKLTSRLSTKGANIGKKFYGCNRYPKCWYKQDA